MPAKDFQYLYILKVHCLIFNYYKKEAQICKKFLAL